jgi:hypothetical protein
MVVADPPALLHAVPLIVTAAARMGRMNFFM